MDGSDLTPRQQSVLDFIRIHQQNEGMAPTVREICTHLGLKGPAGVHRILNLLLEKGYLITTRGKKRSWRLAEMPDPRSIPLIGRIAAGAPIEAQENREDDLPLDPLLFGSDACFALRVAGDSMIEAHIMDGDLAIIRPQSQVANGEIAAVLVEDVLPEATLKIFHYRPDRITLEAANPAYAPLVFEHEEMQRVRVIGHYVGIIRRQGYR